MVAHYAYPNTRLTIKQCWEWAGGREAFEQLRRMYPEIVRQRTARPDGGRIYYRSHDLQRALDMYDVEFDRKENTLSGNVLQG